MKTLGIARLIWLFVDVAVCILAGVFVAIKSEDDLLGVLVAIGLSVTIELAFRALK